MKKISAYKYFYYISKSKVELLQAQLTTKTNFSEINTTVEFGGAGVGVGLKSQQNNVLAKQTLSLLKIMSKRQLIKPLPLDSETISSTIFYADKSDWHSGLISQMSEHPYENNFNYGDFRYFTAFILWRLLDENTLLLLLGSPNNIIGESEINQKYYVGSTFLIINYLLMAIGKITQEAENTVLSSWELSSFPKALSLAKFCINNLRDLPKYRIDIVFKVFQKLNFVLPDDLPEWAYFIKWLPDSEKAIFEKCRTVIIGSPLYTAIE